MELAIIQKENIDELTAKMDEMKRMFSQAMEDCRNQHVKRYYTLEQVAYMFQVSKDTVRQNWKDEIGYMKEGSGILRFHEDDLKVFAERYSIQGELRQGAKQLKKIKKQLNK